MSAALAAIWGSGFLLIKISLRGFTPVQLTFARLALGALVLVLVLAVMRLRLPGHELIAAGLLILAGPFDGDHLTSGVRRGVTARRDREP